MSITRREVVLGATVALAGAAIVLTEFLSFLQALNRTGLLVSWVLLALAALAVARRLRPPLGLERAGERTAVDAVDALLLAAVGIVLALVLLTAVVAAPNTFDSMTYHLSRVAHWQHNRSAAFYATAIPRQLYQLPGSEYLLAQPYILFGGDRWVNLVQWWALAGSTLGVSLLARRLGAGRRGQLVTALACVTLPMAVLQGSSTQCDLLTALWIVCALAFGARMAVTWSLPATLLTALSVGLALLTKATAGLFLAPFAPVLLLAAYRRRERRCWAALLTAVAVASCLSAPQLLRTHRLSGQLLGPMREVGGDYGYLVERVTPGTVVSGLARNLALQASGPSITLNRRMEGAIRAGHRALGLDPDEPATTWSGQRFAIAETARDEDAAGAPVHGLLLAALIGGLWISPRRRRRLLLYAAAPAAGFLLFSTLLKWTPWHTRLHLPLLILATPLIGTGLPRRGARAVAALLALLLLAAALGPLLRNRRRPLLPPASVLQTSRSEQYFAGNPDVRPSYLETLRVLEEELHCAEVGLALGPDDYEYPLWALAGGIGGRAMRFTHVAVANPSARFEDPTWVPCAIVQSSWRQERALTVGGVPFAPVRDLGALRLLEPATAPGPAAVEKP